MTADTADPGNASRGLPVILACAVLQGWALYGLHHAANGKHWPATQPALLLGLYAVVLFIPLTIQLLAEYADSRLPWLLAATLLVAFFGFGFQDGWFVYHELVEEDPTLRLRPLLFVLLLLWLQIMPFVQGRLATGHWRYSYRVLFTKAWRNKLVLAEAALFTGLFWLLLLLWQQLFASLGIPFFKDLFREPIFVYPVTALTFGIALHLIGSVERLTMAILDQLLSVLKWLGTVGGFILVIFSITLAVNLPGLVATGERVIGAAWLLWLVAVMVLLLNAAYRDGTDPQPYPGWLATALRLAVPLTVLVALTAMYALVVRFRQYGLTVERVWAFVVAGSAVLYSVGYSWAALGRANWMQGMGRVNVLGSLVLMTVLTLTLTPALSPYRLAANSQSAVALRSPAPAEGYKSSDRGPVGYLRFDSGGYGIRRLRALAEQPDAARIQAAVTAALEAKNLQQLEPAPWVEALDSLTIYPTGRTLEPALRAAITKRHKVPENRWEHRRWQPGRGGGLYADLNGDGSEEFALVFPDGNDLYEGELYERRANGWRHVGSLRVVNSRRNRLSFAKDIAAGSVSTAEQPWKDLLIGKLRLRVDVASDSAN